jgi:hypothetical protein
MRTPNWKLFTALWVYTAFCVVFPYVLHRGNGFDVTDPFSGYPWNFSPFYAVSLFGGAYLCRNAGNRALAFLIPPAAYLVFNLLILAITGRTEWATDPSITANYALFALLPAFGLGLNRASGSPLVPALFRAFSASLFFFVASNLVMFFATNWYPHTLNGLASCFFLALPFFGPTLASTMLFTLLLFSPIGVPATAPAHVLPGRIESDREFG